MNSKPAQSVYENTRRSAARGHAGQGGHYLIKSKFGCTDKQIGPEQFSEVVSLAARVALR